MSMLSEILATKRTEVAFRRERLPLSELEKRICDAPPVRDFRASLRDAKGTALIAEVKKASPSKGIIREDFEPISIARIYAEGGASCLSILTDEKYFQGHLDYLSRIHEAVSLPLLRKDFILDPWQLAESRVAGADAILLIVAALGPQDLRSLLHVAGDYGLSALVEVHDRDEMTEALEAGANFIGINNRDLHTFRTSLSVTLDLLRDLTPDPERLLISESGIFTRADIVMLENAGIDAVLIGESLMREADIAAKLHQLLDSPDAI